ncbi:polysaccharide pyruvyl transferase family protein [Oribacterium sp. NK2B42]|uniref:polysaccharide pyruvyl transferase family protein n=1 Tax=Oribacterium sp. NK2B42 TaxID=689781 RepID=UPI0003FDF5D0|nr:polysaccharide pyruvyl transferase family protein [Oribacterium sp. NK2B42]
MKKIATLTFHRTTNYGALLQALALQKKLEMLGASTEIIDYRCSSIERRESVVVPAIEKNIYHYATEWKDYVLQKNKRSLISDFAGKNLKISEKSYTRKTIIDLNDKYDGFIVGSDMVWELGITNGDFTYFLDFVCPRKRFSYAASIGVTEFPVQFRERAFDELKNFNRISVRESSAQEYLGFNLKRKVSVDIDPTLLLDSNFWIKYEEVISKYQSKKYILLYFLDSEGIMIGQAIKMAHSCDAEIIVLSDIKETIEGCTVMSNVSVGGFLYLLHHAYLVITGSFHGMVFSMNYNTNFMYFNRANSSRMQSIANLTGCSDRQITKDTIPSFECDFSIINNRLELLRSMSTEYLQQIINN